MECWVTHRLAVALGTRRTFLALGPDSCQQALEDEVELTWFVERPWLLVVPSGLCDEDDVCSSCPGPSAGLHLA